MTFKFQVVLWLKRHFWKLFFFQFAEQHCQAWLRVLRSFVWRVLPFWRPLGPWELHQWSVEVRGRRGTGPRRRRWGRRPRAPGPQVGGNSFTCSPLDACLSMENNSSLNFLSATCFQWRNFLKGRERSSWIPVAATPWFFSWLTKTGVAFLVSKIFSCEKSGKSNLSSDPTWWTTESTLHLLSTQWTMILTKVSLKLCAIL